MESIVQTTMHRIGMGTRWLPRIEKPWGQDPFKEPSIQGNCLNYGKLLSLIPVRSVDFFWMPGPCQEP